MATKSKKKNNSLDVKMLFSPAGLILFALVFGIVGYCIRALTHAAPANSSSYSTSSTSGSSIHLDQSSPTLGSMVTFTVSYPKIKGNITPRIDLKCYQDVNGDGTITYQQNGMTTISPDLVYGETASTDQQAQTKLTGQPGLTLGGGGSIWKTRGGSAICKADLFYYSSGSSVYNYLATTGTWTAGAAQ